MNARLMLLRENQNFCVAMYLLSFIKTCNLELLVKFLYLCKTIEQLVKSYKIFQVSLEVRVYKYCLVVYYICKA